MLVLECMKIEHETWILFHQLSLKYKEEEKFNENMEGKTYT